MVDVVVVDVVDVVVVLDVDVVVDEDVVEVVVVVLVVPGVVVVVVVVGHSPSRATQVRYRLSRSSRGLPFSNTRARSFRRPVFRPRRSTGTSVKAPHAESSPGTGTRSGKTRGGLRSGFGVQAGMFVWLRQNRMPNVQMP